MNVEIHKVWEYSFLPFNKTCFYLLLRILFVNDHCNIQIKNKCFDYTMLWVYSLILFCKFYFRMWLSIFIDRGHTSVIPKQIYVYTGNIDCWKFIRHKIIIKNTLSRIFPFVITHITLRTCWNTTYQWVHTKIMTRTFTYFFFS